jgi:hypothetical protein
VHWGKFTLAFHAWDESIARVTAESRRLGVKVLHPMIGAEMPLTDTTTTSRWWELDARLRAADAASAD